MQVNLHFSSGMLALVTMTGPATGVEEFQQTGVNRTYYIQVRSTLVNSTSHSDFGPLSTQHHTQVAALMVRHHTFS